MKLHVRSWKEIQDAEQALIESGAKRDPLAKVIYSVCVFFAVVLVLHYIGV